METIENNIDANKYKTEMIVNKYKHRPGNLSNRFFLSFHINFYKKLKDKIFIKSHSPCEFNWFVGKEGKTIRI